MRWIALLVATACAAPRHEPVTAVSVAEPVTPEPAASAEQDGAELAVENTPPPLTSTVMVDGTVSHRLPVEQLVHRPIPIYVEVPKELGVDSAQVRYKPFGSTKYSRVDMWRSDNVFEAWIPCDELISPGDLRYYVVLYDEEREPIAVLGSLKHPHSVAMKRRLDGDPPTLPGRRPPGPCPSPWKR